MIKTLIVKIALFIVIIASFSSCSTEKKKRIIKFPQTDLSTENLIPKPLKIIPTQSGFTLDEYTVIQTSQNSKDYDAVGKFLSEKIQKKTDLELSVNANVVSDIQTIINIKQFDIPDLKDPEAYELDIAQDTITLTSNTATGAFRGIQTLRQLIPEVSNDTLATNKIWIIPSGKIIDSPQFEYRATMLDVARHFFDVEDVKKYIDVLSYYKINTLHLHLSDDQGWRIEIKSWPKLTEIGGLTEVGDQPGGFYTQEQYTEIVNYAAKHHITIVPEIDMPGHTNAASVSYPILNGNGKPLKPYKGTRVGFSTFDTKKDTVYTFIDDVVGEIATLSPGPYFHIGGDESHVTKKDDYVYFINKVEKIVQKHGKQLIGWDEVANTEIDSTSIAQIWLSNENKQKAIKKGMKIILSPSDKSYLDMKYDANSKYGLDWAGHTTVKEAYDWSIEDYSGGHAIGIDAPLWSETISTIDELEYLAFPRVIGHAELGWSTKENRGWEHYKVRLANQAPFLKRMNVNYYRSPLIDWKDTELKSTSAKSKFNTLVWSDEFEGNGTIDTTKWFHQTKLPPHGSWYNNEVQHYTNRTDNSFVKDGFLHIVAKKETFEDQGQTKAYTSARLNSKFAFTYGRVEVRAKLPTGIGTWPAIWMLNKTINEKGAYWQTQGFGSASWPKCGEIDIMEHWGSKQNLVQSALHTASSYGDLVKNLGGRTIENVSNEFHVYAAEWTKESITFSVDGITHYTYNPKTKTKDTWPFTTDQYLLLNIAIEPKIDASFTEGAMVVDYVRVYQ